MADEAHLHFPDEFHFFPADLLIFFFPLVFPLTQD
jgi:hypothetical protein